MLYLFGYTKEIILPAVETRPDAGGSSPSYIPSLDGLRAISILIVFVAHVGFGNVVPGGFGVTVFFFLSGYLITTLLTRELDQFGTISQPAFYLRRVLRLGPPIVITLILAIGLSALGLAQGEADPMTLLSQIFFFYNYYALYASDAGTVQGMEILWSLAVEEHFYLIWPALFILLAGGKIGLRTLLGILVAILIWRFVRYYAFGASEWTIYVSTDTRFDSLLYGCLLAILAWKGHADRLFPATLHIRIAYIGAALIVLVLCLLIRDGAFRSTLRYSLQGLALMPIFHYAVTRPRDLIFRPLNWKPMRKIGQWSYTIYLGHFVIINALIYNGVATSASPLLIVLSGALSAAYAAAVYRWLEKPLHPLRRQLTGHGKTRATALQ